WLVPLVSPKTELYYCMPRNLADRNLQTLRNFSSRYFDITSITLVDCHRNFTEARWHLFTEKVQRILSRRVLTSSSSHEKSKSWCCGRSLHLTPGPFLSLHRSAPSPGVPRQGIASNPSEEGVRFLGVPGRPPP